MSRPDRRTTIVDVARAAGVSYKTVSRVLNDEPYVSQDVQGRVRAAVKELNYHPNILAQGLARQRSFLIGLVSENPSSSYGVELQRGIQSRLENERYRLVVIPAGSISEHGEEVVPWLRAAALDGVVLAPPASDHPAILDQLGSAGIAFARVAPTRQLDLGPSTLMDDTEAAREIAEYLLGQGHRDIGVIKGDPTHRSSEARLIGYSLAFAKYGVALRIERIEQGDYTFDSGLAAARRMLGGSERPTAILAQNDDMAVGALMAAHELGIAVPAQLSVSGFDDSEFARIVWPRLTTVRQPVFDMALSAADMLLARLERRAVEQLRRHRHTLVLRDSVAPLAAG